MKKILLLGFIGILLSYSFTPAQMSGNVDKNALSASCKKALEPYKYDSQKFTRINFTKKAQQLEVEVPVFIGEKYRVVFNLSALPEQPPIAINIYTKSNESGKREPIFSNKSVAPGTTELIFDVPRVRKLYIDYDVPAIEGDAEKVGHILFMIGYK